LRYLPENVNLHVISHSRGGLIGEILSHYHSGNAQRGFNEARWKSFVKAYDPALLNEMNKTALAKKITIDKFIRVACPAQGTELASKRLDHYLNALINVIQISFPAAAPVLKVLNSLLADVLSCKEDSDVLPGIEAMVPDSVFQRTLNHQSQILNAPLTVVAGNSKFAMSKRGFINVLIKLYYWRQNDWIVDTQYMLRGTPRHAQFPVMIDEGEFVNHFGYFENKRSQTAIRFALQAANDNLPEYFEWMTPQQAIDYDRGILMGSYESDEYNDQKPILFILPGILGTNLSLNGKEVYLKFDKLAAGGMKDLAIEVQNITPSSIIGNFYGKFADEMKADFNVIAFGFDRRKSVADSAQLLADKINAIKPHIGNQPICFAAHSMGGLVMRQFMLDHSALWKELQDRNGFRLLFCGSPLGGSYLIPEVLVGQGSRIRQMSMVDITSSSDELLEVFSKYQGIQDLLPIDARSHDFGIKSTWDKMLQKTKPGSWFSPIESDIERFKKFRETILNAGEQIYGHQGIFYIAGKSDETVESFYYNESQKGANKIKFTHTERGDGSVTWDSGIPSILKKQGRLYFVDAQHGALLKEKSLFSGIRDILLLGQTQKFSTSEIPTKKGFFARLFRDELLPGTAENIANAWLCDYQPMQIVTSKISPPIEVSITNGDLHFAQYPVMIGHIMNDAIMSAEAVLDRNLNYTLSRSYQLGNYPQEVGSNDVFRQNGDIRAIIVGLGRSERLTPAKLEQTVSQGIIKYLIELNNSNTKENKQDNVGLSVVFIGSSYVGISLESCIRAIVNGATKANEALMSISEITTSLSHLEFIELFEDKCLQALLSIRRIKKNQEFHFFLDQENIRKQPGGRKRIIFDGNQDWWQRIIVSEIDMSNRIDHIPGNTCIKFVSASSTARAEEYSHQVNDSITRHLINGISISKKWNDKYARALFELLIPVGFKSEMQGYQKMLLLLDKKTAAYPWELIQDSNTQIRPMSTEVGIIRQLSTVRFRNDIPYATGNKALIIADPLTEKFLPQLDGAKQEGEVTHSLLKSAGFEVEPLINSTASEIINALYGSQYKVLHLAAHGKFDYQNAKVGGMVIGPDLYLSSLEFHQLPYVPELVFVNCCYLGMTDTVAEAFYQDRNEFAANVGTELIEKGVRAVIVAGWAVNDDAALHFSRIFYDEMLRGTSFGEATLIARKSCYQNYPGSNTWGAYQCYGDQSYRLVEAKYWNAQSEKEYLVEAEIEMDLHNLHHQVDGHFNKESNASKLAHIENQLYNKFNDNAELFQFLALIYMEYGMDEKALTIFQHMKTFEMATYSVRSLERHGMLIRKMIQRKSGQSKDDIVVLEKIVEEVKLLQKIYETAERFQLLGGTHKAIFLAKKRLNLGYKSDLTAATAYYKRSYEVAKSLEDNTIYPLVNYIELRKAEIDSNTNSKKESISAAYRDLEDMLVEIKREEKRLLSSMRGYDHWIRMTPANRMLCELLVHALPEHLTTKTNIKTEKAKQTKKLKELFKEIDEVKNLGGSELKWGSEIDHVRFLKELYAGQTLVCESLTKYEMYLLGGKEK
jgi:hypothetical protein